MVKLDVYLPVLRADINNSVIVDYNLTDSMVKCHFKSAWSPDVIVTASAVVPAMLLTM